MVGRPKAATGPSSPLRLAEEWEGGRRTARIALHGACTAESGNGAGGSGGGAVARALRGAFLPDGYPASVSSDYLSEPSRSAAAAWPAAADRSATPSHTAPLALLAP